MVSCVNKECDSPLERGCIQEHVRLSCNYTEVSCKYASVQSWHWYSLSEHSDETCSSNSFLKILIISSFASLHPLGHDVMVKSHLVTDPLVFLQFPPSHSLSLHTSHLEPGSHDDLELEVNKKNFINLFNSLFLSLKYRGSVTPQVGQEFSSHSSMQSLQNSLPHPSSCLGSLATSRQVQHFKELPGSQTKL